MLKELGKSSLLWCRRFDGAHRSRRIPLHLLQQIIDFALKKMLPFPPAAFFLSLQRFVTNFKCREQKLRRKFWSRNTLQGGPDGPDGQNGHAAETAKPAALARMREWLRVTHGLSAKDRVLKSCPDLRATGKAA